METGERLAAYLSGDLDADERAALQAELDRDPALRAQLHRIEATDAALARLDAVEMPADFAAQLRTRVSEEIHDTPRDELAVRRARHGLPVWTVRLAAAAAALAVIGGGAAMVSNLSGGDDTSFEAADTGDDAATSMLAEPEGARIASVLDGPVLFKGDAAYDESSIAALRDDPRFDALLRGELGPDAARELQQRFLAALEMQGGEAGRMEADSAVSADAAEDDAAEDDAGGDETTEQSAPAADVQTLGDVSEEDLADVRRCLEEIVSSAEPAVPMYAELATFEGEDAIIYALATQDPESGSLTRVEIWVASRDDCQVRYFTQLDR